MRKALMFTTFLIISNLAYAKEIEVIVGGKSYYSVDSYKATQRNKVTPQEAVPPEVVPEKADPMTIKAMKELSSISSEDSVGRVRADFDQNWDNPSPKFKIASEELQQRLESIADNRKEPVLVVSENGKLRVMLLNEETANSGDQP